MNAYALSWKLLTRLTVVLGLTLTMLTMAQAEMRVASARDYVSQPLVFLIPDGIAKNIVSDEIDSKVRYVAKINGNYYSGTASEIENYAFLNNYTIVTSWSSSREPLVYTGIITIDEYVEQLKSPWGRAGFIFMGEDGHLYVNME
jgi:hypothetical protein